VSVSLHRVLTGPADAPPLLLGNSLGTDLRMWDSVVSHLGDRFRIVRFDHRGQGASPVPEGPYDIEDLGRDAVALLDELEIDAAAFCGVSIGGMVALWLGAHAPERVKRVIVCCRSAYPAPREQWAKRARIVADAGSTAHIPMAERPAAVAALILEHAEVAL
jgi:pimeloyl-ACP methyl ester carboxylesterase